MLLEEIDPILVLVHIIFLVLGVFETGNEHLGFAHFLVMLKLSQPILNISQLLNQPIFVVQKRTVLSLLPIQQILQVTNLIVELTNRHLLLPKLLLPVKLVLLLQLLKLLSASLLHARLQIEQIHIMALLHLKDFVLELTNVFVQLLPYRLKLLL